MAAAQVLARLRQFLLVIATVVFLTTVAELYFVGHWTVPIQFLPFFLCAWGLLALGLAYFHPGPATIQLLRWSMVFIGLCSSIGLYEHMANNLAFQMEIQPNSSTWELLIATLEGGIPVMAPGILALGAAIGWTAAYQWRAP
jgi:hypothetical protein